MHDFEAPIFDAMADALDAAFPGITVVSADLPSSEPTFPTALLRCVDMSADERSAESGDMEPRTVAVFELQAYSNRSRREAKAIAAKADELMASWGWRRTTLAPVDGEDRTIRRYVARWRGSVDAGGMVAR